MTCDDGHAFSVVHENGFIQFLDLRRMYFYEKCGTTKCNMMEDKTVDIFKNFTTFLYCFTTFWAQSDTDCICIELQA